MKHVKVVCALIINDRKEVFCAKRGPGRALEGYFEFPGGKAEAGESLQAAIVREIKEELNSVVAPVKYIGESYYEYSSLEKPFAITLYGYVCYLKQGNLELSEHTESKWAGKDELSSLIFAPADLPFVEYLKKALL